MRRGTKWIRDKSDSKLKGNDSSVIGAREPVTLKSFVMRRNVEKRILLRTRNKWKIYQEEFSFFTYDNMNLEDQRVFVIDSGCSNYVIKDRDLFTSLDETYRGEYECANKSSSKNEGIGTVEFFVQQKDGRKAKITLQDALFTPENGRNLLSLAKLKQSGATMHFAETDELVITNVTRFELEPSKNLFIWRMVTNPDLECNKANMPDEHFRHKSSTMA